MTSPALSLTTDPITILQSDSRVVWQNLFLNSYSWPLHPSPVYYLLIFLCCKFPVQPCIISDKFDDFLTILKDGSCTCRRLTDLPTSLNSFTFQTCHKITPDSFLSKLKSNDLKPGLCSLLFYTTYQVQSGKVLQLFVTFNIKYLYLISSPNVLSFFILAIGSCNDFF